jgi:hypothetical protein
MFKTFVPLLSDRSRKATDMYISFGMYLPSLKETCNP